MRFLCTRQSLPWWLLIISIAFNLGFGATYGVKSYGEPTGARDDAARPGGGVMSMASLDQDLELSPEQVEQARQINDELLQAIGELRDEMRETRIVLADVLAAGDLDDEALDRQLEAIGEIQRSAQRLVIDHLLQEKQLLRPDQVDEFNEVVRNRVCAGYGRGHGEGRGMGRGGRGGRGGGGGGRSGGGTGHGGGGRGQGN